MNALDLLGDYEADKSDHPMAESSLCRLQMRMAACGRKKRYLEMLRWPLSHIIQLDIRPHI